MTNKPVHQASHHLFRLPTTIETAIHHEMIESIPNDYDIEANLWSEIDDLPQAEVQPEAGSINLNSLDLTSKKAIAKTGSDIQVSDVCRPHMYSLLPDCRMSRREHYSTALAKSQGIVSETHLFI